MTNKTDKNSNAIRAAAQLQSEQTPTDTKKKGQNPLQSAPELFGSVISIYSRKNALADGVQVDISATAKTHAFEEKVFLTRAVFERYIRVPETVACKETNDTFDAYVRDSLNMHFQDSRKQHEFRRLWDMLCGLKIAIFKAGPNTRRFDVELYVWRVDEGGFDHVILAAENGTTDFDDPTPAITIMMSDED